VDLAVRWHRATGAAALEGAAVLGAATGLRGTVAVAALILRRSDGLPAVLRRPPARRIAALVPAGSRAGAGAGGQCPVAVGIPPSPPLCARPAARTSRRARWPGCSTSCPPTSGVTRRCDGRYPAALESTALHHARAWVEGARQGYRAARAELGVSLPPHAVDGVLAAYRTEGFKLASVARGVELVGRAIHGEVFALRL
jgi:hypothetical protein